MLLLELLESSLVGSSGLDGKLPRPTTKLSLGSELPS